MSGLTYLIGDVCGYWRYKSAGRIRCLALSADRLRRGKNLRKDLFENKEQAEIAALILGYKHEKVGTELVPYACETCRTGTGAPGWHLGTWSFRHSSEETLHIQAA